MSLTIAVGGDARTLLFSWAQMRFAQGCGRSKQRDIALAYTASVSGLCLWKQCIAPAFIQEPLAEKHLRQLKKRTVKCLDTANEEEQKEELIVVVDSREVPDAKFYETLLHCRSMHIHWLINADKFRLIPPAVRENVDVWLVGTASEHFDAVDNRLFFDRLRSSGDDMGNIELATYGSFVAKKELFAASNCGLALEHPTWAPIQVPLLNSREKMESVAPLGCRWQWTASDACLQLPEKREKYYCWLLFKEYLRLFKSLLNEKAICKWMQLHSRVPWQKQLAETILGVNKESFLTLLCSRL